ncbi:MULTISPECIES: polyribonucleotide nucleotidyltransferase [Atopobium]|uniref:Polyribonucleotide nucleotidyltransferase n=2 Tax=Atopobium minutum TaxID=1381 RepID=N2BTI0_9ACTN|nr:MULTISPECIES: polyribonucleotide nucleotidyltransferase [Atopobium]EMZ41853.1 polyribonucleotide nucleotidyltransferase [Atopobium minutum 10063974]ERL14086.1 polyribonucleotide nucleotidyltransferase [Atopobium sp. BV3Ac4]KRN54996.1 Polyribonucleotide nucleotidyltransferase [Atopobium minutum]MBS4873291.1 polyribonucleotide nucleotidyltransferase [Atopobium minutum]MDU4970448.1 polyribonucleotide nucleotidyltransferase [Atopobium minutum]
MTKVTHEFDLYGKHYVLESGELAKQATGACLVSCGDSTVLLTAVVSDERKDYDFFPLTVDFIEKMYAVGRIPGGYLKREARPSEKATLTARMIDRPLRPSFPEGFRNEVQVVATSLVADQIHAVDTICIMGASVALAVGGVPFEGPLACVRIGRSKSTGEFMVNPSYEERADSDLDLELAGSDGFISMLEAGAEEISEQDMLAAMAFGQQAIAAFCEEQKKFLAKYEAENGPIEQREYILDEPIVEVHERIFAHYDEMSAALKNEDKQSRIGCVAALKEQIKAEFSDEELEEWSRAIAVELKSLEKHAMRMMVVETGERVDGRVANEVRPLMVKPDYLPLVHGSGLFQRGQTQVLSVATLGMLNEWQRLDTIEPVEGKRYIHHYNFPPYCTGETGRMGSPKRRELGHGALAERALLPVLPSEEEFPYAIRVVSEVMESNGSSSMASTCGSTLALMDAGVPIKRPVSGVAMGLIQEEGKTVVLTDIQGLEDFLGDMDFKVTGTERGITAMQMDNKATGLTAEIFEQAMKQSHEGRMHILQAMLHEIEAPRAHTKETAPTILSLQIPVDKIRDVIGSGGKVIRSIQDETGATIDIQEDGTVFIAGVGSAGTDAAERVKAIVKVPEPGEEYTGRVVGIQAFGAFVELLPGKDGLLHISRVAQGRVNKVEDVLNVGDEVKVRVLEVDDKGKISLDRIDKPEVSTGDSKNGDAGKPRASRNDKRRPGDQGSNTTRKPRRHHEAN